MPRSKAGPTSYTDVREMLDIAIQRGGAQFECGTLNNAIKTVQRMNQFRIIDRKINYETTRRYVPDETDLKAVHRYNLDINHYHALFSVYDHLIIKRPRDSRVIIEKKPERPYLAIYDLDGNRLPDPPTWDEIREKQINENIQNNIPVELPAVTNPLKPPREKFDPSKSLGLTDDEC